MNIYERDLSIWLGTSSDLKGPIHDSSWVLLSSKFSKSPKSSIYNGSNSEFDYLTLFDDLRPADCSPPKRLANAHC